MMSVVSLRTRAKGRSMRGLHVRTGITKPNKFADLRVSVPSLDGLEDVQLVRRIRRPTHFRALEVAVPSDDERHELPHLPAKALEVYPGLPIIDDWGAMERSALARLKYLRIVDTCAYHESLAAGVSAPPPPDMRV